MIDGEYDAVGWNRYTYVLGNPIVYRDPTGHGGVTSSWDNDTSQGKNSKASNSNSESWYSNVKETVENALIKAKQKEGAISPSSHKAGTAVITEGGPYYSDNTKHPHKGIDIRCRKNDKMVSVVEGTIVGKYTGDERAHTLTIQDKDGNRVNYRHITSTLKKGDSIKPGDILGKPNLSGKVSGYHIHMDAKDKRGRSIDPVKYMRKVQPDLKFKLAKDYKYSEGTQKMYETKNPEALKIINESPNNKTNSLPKGVYF